MDFQNFWALVKRKIPPGKRIETGFYLCPWVERWHFDLPPNLGQHILLSLNQVWEPQKETELPQYVTTINGLSIISGH